MLSSSMEIKNKVTESGIVTIDLENFLPEEEICEFDIKDFLFMGMILKEKDFREALKNVDWTIYKGKNVAICCTADAIVPLWAYMLVTTYLQPVALFIAVGGAESVKKTLLLQTINKLDTAQFAHARIVIKGCGEKLVGDYAYAEITRVLLPVVQSLMYGEPCSTVPVYKRR